MSMKNRIYMFEGCDRTGKSTFIKFLKNDFIRIGLNPVIFHLTGPPKFEGLNFTIKEKSLMQLVKFDDEYKLFREILNENINNIIILDRTSFGEYVWSRYWNRIGCYTDYIMSNMFNSKNQDLFDQTKYIYYWMSDVNCLKQRILESPEDEQIFTLNNRTITENIQYVYNMYENLNKMIKSYFNSYKEIDSSQFKSISDIPKYIENDFYSE